MSLGWHLRYAVVALRSCLLPGMSLEAFPMILEHKKNLADYFSLPRHVFPGVCHENNHCEKPSPRGVDETPWCGWRCMGYGWTASCESYSPLQQQKVPGSASLLSIASSCSWMMFCSLKMAFASLGKGNRMAIACCGTPQGLACHSLATARKEQGASPEQYAKFKAAVREASDA